jgi:PKHD-type hydroxylase
MNSSVPNYVTYPYVCWDNFFTDEELDRLEKYCDTGDLESLCVMDDAGESIIDHDFRQADGKIHFMDLDNKWIFQKLTELSTLINDQVYNYNITDFNFFQYTEYNKVGSKHNLHMDMVLGDKVPKDMILPLKLSCSLILSDIKDFEGCDFEVMIDWRNIPIEQKRGRLIAFPSFMPHRITPLVSGKRKAIVFWVRGPRFK